MSKADNGLRKLTHKHLTDERVLGAGNAFRCTPIETGGVTSGVPDTYWAHQLTGQQGWIEHKATDAWAVTVRPHQVAFALTHLRCGVRVHLLVRSTGVKATRGVGDSLWLLRGEAAAELVEPGRTLKTLDPWLVLGFWPGTPQQWPWQTVGQLLLAP